MKVDGKTLLLLGALGLGLGVAATMKGSSSRSGSKVQTIDVRDKAADAVYSRGSVKGLKKRRNFLDWEDLDSITLHQVGVDNVGDSAWWKMTAHLGVTEDGRIYIIHPLNTHLYHGHGFNKRSVSIEVGGKWKKGETLPKAQRDAIRQAIRMIKATVAKKGGKIRYIYAHRQSSSQRGNDPGPQIWEGAALWAEKALKLKTDPFFTTGSGLTIPPEWDSRLEGRTASIANDPNILRSGVDVDTAFGLGLEMEGDEHDHADLTPEEMAEVQPELAALHQQLKTA